ncbi:MAG TPA: DUF4190 domain-containing protein [Acidimicrobiales bacterium]
MTNNDSFTAPPQAPYPGYASSPSPAAPPPTGWPSPTPPPPRYRPHKLSGLAVASLVLGITWIFWLGSILALIFGYLALRQIKRTGDSGKGLAIGGIVLGWIGVVTLVGVIALAAAASDDDPSSSEETRTAATDGGGASESDADEGPITNSGNTENPPTEDVELTECGAGVVGGGGPFVGAAGTITNHSSEPSDYLITVEFVADGVRYDESLSSATAVAPGQSVEWEAPGFEEARPGTECTITQVERYAS